jgi:hypothetical protein
MTNTLDKAIEIVDEHLSPTNERTIYSSDEVQDMLLDLRILLELAAGDLTDGTHVC